MTMKILVGVNGFAWSDRAVALLDQLSWPADTIVHVVTAYEPPIGVPGLPGAVLAPGLVDAVDSAFRCNARRLVESTVDQLTSPGRRVSGDVVSGRAASALLRAGRELEADVILVGCDGGDGDAALGPVAAEVAANAHCSVLVARGEKIGNVLFADDGSDAARAAGELLGGWPTLREAAIRVLSVSPVAVPVPSWPSSEKLDLDLEIAAAGMRGAHAAIATAAADRLRQADLRVEAEDDEGDPAHRIVDRAASIGADLIVLAASRGTDVALGSVARGVLLHAPCSVLIVRH